MNGQGRAGSYWERATVQKRTTNRDTATGYKAQTFTDDATYWCYTSDVKAVKRLAYGVMNSQVDTQIHFRGYPDIDAKDRIIVLTTGYLYEPQGVTLDYENGETVVMARRVPSLEGS